ncbi:hypothetical protein D3C71_2023020 [compost metagenome]
MPGAADVQGEVFVHDLHAQARQRRLWTPRPQLARALVECGNRVGQAVGAVTRDLWDVHLAHDVVDHVPQGDRRAVTDVVRLAQGRTGGQQTAEQRFV